MFACAKLATSPSLVSGGARGAPAPPQRPRPCGRRGRGGGGAIAGRAGPEPRGSGPGRARGERGGAGGGRAGCGSAPFSFPAASLARPGPCASVRGPRLERRSGARSAQPKLPGLVRSVPRSRSNSSLLLVRCQAGIFCPCGDKRLACMKMPSVACRRSHFACSRPRFPLQEELCARADMTLDCWEPKDTCRPLVENDSFICASLNSKVQITSVHLTTLKGIFMAFICSFQNVFHCLLVDWAFLSLFSSIFCQHNACICSLTDVAISNISPENSCQIAWQCLLLNRLLYISLFRDCCVSKKTNGLVANSLFILQTTVCNSCDQMLLFL